MAANWLALGFSAASLALVVAMVLRLRLSPGLAPLAHAAARRWCCSACSRTGRSSPGPARGSRRRSSASCCWPGSTRRCSRRGGRGALAWLSLTAGLLALTRPDGLLFVGGDGGDPGRALGSPTRALSPRALAPGAAAADPGRARAVAAGAATATGCRIRITRSRSPPGPRRACATSRRSCSSTPTGSALGAGAGRRRAAAAQRQRFAARLRAWDPELAHAGCSSAARSALHFAYYTFLVGGDHFEFRVYQHWVPLLLVWLRRARRAGRPLAARARSPRWWR